MDLSGLDFESVSNYVRGGSGAIYGAEYVIPLAREAEELRTYAQDRAPGNLLPGMQGPTFSQTLPQ